jgi:hypothetical protein
MPAVVAGSWAIKMERVRGRPIRRSTSVTQRCTNKERGHETAWMTIVGAVVIPGGDPASLPGSVKDECNN